MSMLLIETSNALCGVAVSINDRIVCELSCVGKKIHSIKLMEFVETALSLSGTSISEMDAFAVIDGPGSYTGIRIGMSVVKALGQVQEKPCVCIDSLEALAMDAPFFRGVICPLIDAKADHVFTAQFRAGFPPVRITGDSSRQIDELLIGLKEETGEPCLFLGDVDNFKTKIVSVLGKQAVFADSCKSFPTPGNACRLAGYYFKNGIAIRAEDICPRYLKRPNV